jgi:hypothetical protein
MKRLAIVVAIFVAFQMTQQLTPPVGAQEQEPELGTTGSMTPAFSPVTW